MSFTVPLMSSFTSRFLVRHHHLPPTFFHGTTLVNPKTIILSRRPFSTTYGPAAKAASQATSNDVVTETSSKPGYKIVYSFYAAINNNDLSSAKNLIAQDCVYEDLIFSSPFVGRTAILDFFGKFIEATSTDMQFVIDDISKEDTSAVGVSWHLEWKGKLFPCSKTCSFYRLKDIDGKKQIVYVRDCVEPAIKPGQSVIAAVKGVAWLLRKFPQIANRF